MRLRSRTASLIAKALERLIADPAPADRLIRALERARHARELIGDVQTAVWHLGGLPSRQDVYRALRRTATITRKLAELERMVAEIEAIAGAEEDGGGEERPEEVAGPTT